MTCIENVIKMLKTPSFRGAVKTGEVLCGHTTMHVGGQAALFVEPEDTESLAFAVHTCAENGVRFFILGGGSNVIISDAGFDGAVISTRKLNAISLDAASNRLTVGAGAVWGSVISFCREHNLGGFEAFTGLSGTAGGALYMNATCFGLSACDNLVSAEYFDCTDGKVHTYTKEEADWGYKRSPFQRQAASPAEKIGGVTGVSPVEWGAGATAEAQLPECGAGERLLPSKIIVSAVFSAGGPFDEEKSRTTLESRKEKGHFRAPSAGSTFKNPEGLVAGKLIDECGLKGFSVGGAQIAPWHGNFVINRGNATAADIQKLMEIVREKVLKEKGVELEAEVIRL